MSEGGEISDGGAGIGRAVGECASSSVRRAVILALSSSRARSTLASDSAALSNSRIMSSRGLGIGFELRTILIAWSYRNTAAVAHDDSSLTDILRWEYKPWVATIKRNDVNRLSVHWASGSPLTSEGTGDLLQRCTSVKTIARLDPATSKRPWVSKSAEALPVLKP